MNCKIQMYSDMTKCHTCDLGWDTNDPHPPMCGQYALKIAKRELDKQIKFVDTVLVVWFFCIFYFISISLVKGLM